MSDSREATTHTPRERSDSEAPHPYPHEKEFLLMPDSILAAAITPAGVAPGPNGTLDLNRLRILNKARCESAFKHSIEEWSPTDWATAMAGEVGEACNLIKKLRRGENVDLTDIAFELADAVIYIDLLCERLGINLGAAIVEKFNIVSTRVHSPVHFAQAKRHCVDSHSVQNIRDQYHAPQNTCEEVSR